MIITYVYADRNFEWNTSEWRCAIPARSINRTGKHSAHLIDFVEFEKNTSEVQFVCEQSDFIVVERALRGEVLSAIQRWKARDKVVIANFDDAYNLMPKNNISYPYWFEGRLKYLDQDKNEFFRTLSPTPIVQFKWGLRLVHGAIVPSHKLVEDWRDLTDMVYLPNYIDLPNYEDVHSPPHEGIIIGWGGSLSHLQSFTDSGVLNALRKVCKKRPQVRLMIAGHRGVFDQIPIPPEQKIFQPFVPFNQWPGVLGNFDIGLAPLHGPYDARRSWIKPLEYMVMKIPWLASDNPAYEDLTAYGKIVKNSENSWEKALIEVIDNLDQYKQFAQDLPYKFGVSQAMDSNVEKVLSIFSQFGEKVNGVKYQV